MVMSFTCQNKYFLSSLFQLLDCFVVPIVLALSWLLLKVRYRLVHVLGVGLCLLGIGCLVWANVEDGKQAIPGG